MDRVRPDADGDRRSRPNNSVVMVLITMVGFTLLYGVLAVVMVGLVLRRVRHGLPAADRRHGLRARGRAGARARVLGERHGSHDDLVRAHRRPLDRLLRPGGLRLRRRHPAPRHRPQRARAAGDAPHDRPGLGRQRGLAARRRRRDVRGLPGVVRDPVLGLLPRPVRDPRRAHRPGHRDRVPQQARRPRLALAVDGRSRSAASCRPCCGASRSRTSCGRADRRRQGVHRHLLHAAQPVRAPGRAHDAAAVRHPRRSCSSPSRPRARSASGPRRLTLPVGLATAVVAVVFLLWANQIRGDALSTAVAVLAAVAWLGALGAASGPARGLGVLRVGPHDRARGGRACSWRCSRT